MEKVEADVAGTGEKVDMSTLSKAQKKKLKDKLKKEADEKAAAEAAAKGEAPVVAPPKDDKKAKPKKLNAAAALALEKKRLIEEAEAENKKL